MWMHFRAEVIKIKGGFGVLIPEDAAKEEKMVKDEIVYVELRKIK